MPAFDITFHTQSADMYYFTKHAEHGVTVHHLFNNWLEDDTYSHENLGRPGMFSPGNSVTCLVGPSRDHVYVKRWGTDSGFVEVYIQRLVDGEWKEVLCCNLKAVGIPADDDKDWQFVLNCNSDLYCFQMNNTESGHVEVKTLTLAAMFQEVQFHVVLPVEISKKHMQIYQVLMSPANDVVFIQKSKTESDRTEIINITATSGWQTPTRHVTCLPKTKKKWTFGMAIDGSLKAVKYRKSHNEHNTFKACTIRPESGYAVMDEGVANCVQRCVDTSDEDLLFEGAPDDWLCSSDDESD